MGSPRPSLVPVQGAGTVDEAAVRLAARINGRPQMGVSGFTNSDGILLKEFDAISSEFIAQTTKQVRISSKWREQAKATFQAASATERKAYFHFENGASDDMLRKLNDYSERFRVPHVVDTDPLF